MLASARTRVGAGLRRWAAGPAAYRTTVVAGILLLAVVVFRNGGDTVYFDTRPDFYLEPWRTLTRFFSAWTATPYLGSPNYHTGAITSVLPLAVLSALGLTPAAVFTTWHLILLVLAAWGTIRLVRHLMPDVSRYAALFAGVVYVANPWAVDGASVLPIVLSLALFPWQVLVLVKAFQEPWSWRWPALFGLTFFAMAGSNAAVQPLFGLVVVPVVAVFARLAWGVSWRDVVGAVTRCALFVVALSAYWLPATFAAGRAGSAHVDTTETLEGIATTSSFAEVLRGLGFWPLYGGDQDGPWIPAHTAYLDNVFVVVASFAAAGLALLSLLAVGRRLRRLLIALVVVAVVLMVGSYPWSSPSPFGRALRWAFESVPLLALFRTTNKVGMVLVLALAVASAAGVAWLLTRVRRRWLTVPLLLLVLVGISFPAWQGKLYAAEWPIPGYWKEAGRHLDEGPPSERTLVVPGYVTATYRWRGSGRPDEILYGLTERNVVVPAAVQNTTPAAYNFMSALDDTFQSSTGPETSLSTFARLLGAQQVLVRHDFDWETVGGIRPSGVDREISADTGLSAIRNFGDPGENVQGPDQEPDGFFETFVPPLQLYGVSDPSAMVRAEPLGATSVVAGDGWSVPAMTRAGVLQERAPFRYAHDLTADDLAPLLGPGHQIVLTDTNRRRGIVPGTVTHGNSRLLTADEPLTGATRTLGTDPADQTVLTTGRVHATEQLAATIPEQLPGSSPANVLDGDDATSWLAGTPAEAVGSRLRIQLASPRPVRTLTFSQQLLGGAFIRWVDVRAGGEERRVDLSLGPATVDFGGLVTDEVSVEIASLNGFDDNPVGLAEISGLGLKVAPTAKLPTTIDRLYDELTPAQQARFRTTPFQVLMTRARGKDGIDDETNLLRAFTTPVQRDVRARAVARIDTSREDLLDEAAGIPVGARSSSVFLNNPDLRASFAFDDDDTTGWLTNGVLVGSWIEQDGPERDLSSISFTQASWTDDGPTNWITAVAVYVDDQLVRTAEVGRDTTEIELAAEGQELRGEKVRIVVSGDTDPTVPTSPMVMDVDAGRELTADPEAAEDACLDIAYVDGEPVPMRLRDRARNMWVQCGQPTTLDAGDHTVRPVDPSIVLDSLDLISQPRAEVDTAAAPGVKFTSSRGSQYTATVGASTSREPYVLVLSQAFDDRWRATVDGDGIGAPFLVDGHAMGWVIDDPGSHVVELEYGPQDGTTAGTMITGLGLLAVAGTVLLPQPAPRTQPRREPVRRRLSPALGWLAFLIGVFVTTSWIGLVAGVLLAGWHWFRPPDPRVLVVAGASLVAAAGLVTVVYLGVAGDFSYVAVGFWPNAMAMIGLILVVLGGWRHRSATDPDATG